MTSHAARPALLRLLSVLAAVVVLKLLVSAIESRMVFFPFKGEDANPGTLGIEYRQVPIATSDGEHLGAWQLEPEHPVADVVYFHGNGGNLSIWLPVFANLHRLNIRVLAIDYRGYGLSTGTPSEQGLYLDAAAVVAHAQQDRAAGRPRPMVYWGRSLGGPIAAAATRIVSPDGLILESAFPDKVSVIRYHPIFRPLNLFSSYRFSTIDALDGFARPVLVMHGDQDSIIPFRLGQELFERIGGPKQFVAVRGGDHNDAFEPTNRAYWDPVLAFIRGLAGPAGGTGTP